MVESDESRAYLPFQGVSWLRPNGVRKDFVLTDRRIAELQAKIREADSEIGPCKAREGLQATTTKKLIRRRRSYHEKLKPLEVQIYTLQK